MTKHTGSSDGLHSTIKLVTVLMLSVVLAITVTAVIYLAVKQQTTVSKRKHNTPKFMRHGTLQFDTDREEREGIFFYKKDNIVIYRELEGAFGAHDLNKGIYIKKDANNGRCYLIPAQSKSEVESDIEQILAEIDDIKLTGAAEKFEVLEGEITDISFIPSVVQDECHSGYRWLVKSAHQDGGITNRQTVMIKTIPPSPAHPKFDTSKMS